MGKKRTSVDTAPPEPIPQEESNGTGHDNVQVPRKTVRSFSCPCGKDEHLHVDVVESEHQTREGKITILSAVCCRTYINGGAEEKVSYSYRVQHVPLLMFLLQKAHEYIVSTRVVEDIPV